MFWILWGNSIEIGCNVPLFWPYKQSIQAMSRHWLIHDQTQTDWVLSAQSLRFRQRCTVGSLWIWLSVNLKMHLLPSWWWHHVTRSHEALKNIPCRWRANSICHCHPWRKGKGCPSLLYGDFRLPALCISLRFVKLTTPDQLPTQQDSPLRYIVVLRRCTSQLPSSLSMETQSFHRAALAYIYWWVQSNILTWISPLWLHQHYPLHIAFKHRPNPQAKAPMLWATSGGRWRILIANYCLFCHSCFSEIVSEVFEI